MKTITHYLIYITHTNTQVINLYSHGLAYDATSNIKETYINTHEDDFRYTEPWRHSLKLYSTTPVD